MGYGDRSPESASSILVFGLAFGGFLIWEFGPDVMAGTVNPTNLAIGIGTLVVMSIAMAIGYLRNQ